jgi:alkylation response protein AidB-like acyl-CoA dehydrogenase
MDFDAVRCVIFPLSGIHRSTKRALPMSTIDLGSFLTEFGPRFAEAAALRDENDAFVADNYDLLKERKIFSALVPTELGGGGAEHSEICAFLKSLARHCASTALALSMHQHLVAAAVANYRSGRPGRKLLERVAAGEAVLVSTGANDWLESNGSVQRVAGGFLVSAKKPFGSGSPKGEVLVTSAPYEDPVEGWQVLHFTAPFSAEGVSLADDWRAMGMRATGSQTVILERVFVPEEMVVLRRPRGQWHMAWNVILTVALPIIMSVYVGVAEQAAEIARAQAAKRMSDPPVAYLMGELTNLLTTARLALDDMVRIANDFDFQPTVDTADSVLVRKTIIANAVIATVEKALEVCGCAGLRSVPPPPEKRQQLFTGRRALGLDPIVGT